MFHHSLVKLGVLVVGLAAEAVRVAVEGGQARYHRHLHQTGRNRLGVLLELLEPRMIAVVKVLEQVYLVGGIKDLEATNVLQVQEVLRSAVNQGGHCLFLLPRRGRICQQPRRLESRLPNRFSLQKRLLLGLKRILGVCVVAQERTSLISLPREIHVSSPRTKIELIRIAMDTITIVDQNVRTRLSIAIGQIIMELRAQLPHIFTGNVVLRVGVGVEATTDEVVTITPSIQTGTMADTTKTLGPNSLRLLSTSIPTPPMGNIHLRVRKLRSVRSEVDQDHTRVLTAQVSTVSPTPICNLPLPLYLCKPIQLLTIMP